MRTSFITTDENGELVVTRISNMALVRANRDNELRKSDVLMNLPSDRMSDDKRNELIAFREALRQLPQQYPGNARKCDDNFPAWPEGLEELWELVSSGN